MSVRTTQLANGLRIVTEHMPHLETVSLGIWVGTGSRHENGAENGISHMLEHMAFKGTARRSAKEIAEAIENVGGDINAATSLETTAYYARVLRADTGLAIDVLADILQNSIFDPDELEREKDVILQEIAASLDAAEDLVFDTAQEIAFHDQSVGRSILGTPETLAAFDADCLKGYLAQHYHPSRMVMSAAGAVDHDAIVAQVEAAFSPTFSAQIPEIAPAKFVGGRRTISRPIEQSHVVFAFPAPAVGTPQSYTAHVFAGLLGGGMSSRLFQKVREERGLCYSVYAYCWGMSDMGFFGIYAGTAPDMVDDMRDVVFAELADVAVNGPSEVELARAKAQMKSGLLMGLESSSVRAEQMARHLLTYGEILGAQTLIDLIDAVDASDVRAFASELANNDTVAWSEVGPERGTGHLDTIGTPSGGRHGVAAFM